MTGPVRAGPDWLVLREPADAAARSTELVDELRRHLPARGRMVIHDLGAGTGSMTRWLAPRLPGPQRWVLHDRDAELLALAGSTEPPEAADGAAVAVETHLGDITRLPDSELADATLITASALLDMMTADELRRLVESCARAGCPVLITLSVVGDVELSPPDPLDGVVRDAFNAHQRRASGVGNILGPGAADVAIDGFTRLGLDVRRRPSPWLLGPERSALMQEWVRGWVSAACEQDPALREPASGYVRRRTAQASSGDLTVTVHHVDLLALTRRQ